jgi:hypothetical protein
LFLYLIAYRLSDNKRPIKIRNDIPLIVHALTCSVESTVASVAGKFHKTVEETERIAFDACYIELTGDDKKKLSLTEYAALYKVDSKKLREVLTIAALARMSLPNDHPNKLNSTSAATAYKLRRVTLGDRFKALGEDKSIPVPIPLGRKCPISNECFNAIIDFYEAAKSGKVQPDTEDFTRKVEEYRKKYDTTNDLIILQPLSRDQIYRLRWQILPESNSDPSITTDRRTEALNDGFNPIANIVVSMAALGVSEEFVNGTIIPDLLLNIDTMSVVLGHPKKISVFMRPGTTVLHRNKHRSASRLAKKFERKPRSCKLVLLTNAARKCLAAIHVIKERNLNVDYQLTNLGEVTASTTHFLLLVKALPVKGSKEARKIVSDLKAQVSSSSSSTGINHDEVPEVDDEDDDELYERLCTEDNEFDEDFEEELFNDLEEDEKDDSCNSEDDNGDEFDNSSFSYDHSSMPISSIESTIEKGRVSLLCENKCGEYIWGKCDECLLSLCERCIDEVEHDCHGKVNTKANKEKKRLNSVLKGSSIQSSSSYHSPVVNRASSNSSVLPPIACHPLKKSSHRGPVVNAQMSIPSNHVPVANTPLSITSAPKLSDSQVSLPSIKLPSALSASFSIRESTHVYSSSSSNVSHPHISSSSSSSVPSNTPQSKSTTSPALSAKDPKSQLKARKNMWEELVLTVILPAVIKARAEWVRKEQIKNPKFVPPNEDDEILRALLTMDGAFSELEATVALEEELTRFFCEIFKYPGGCSLSYQPNDLMRGFMNFRSKMGSPPKEDLSQDLWSMLAYNVFDILTKSGMDKASVILYTLVYFHRLPEIFVASFTPEIVGEGFRLAGIYPYSIQMMLSACPYFHTLSPELAELIFPGIYKLLHGDDELDIQPATSTGICLDTDIKKVFPFMETPIENMKDKAYNHQRSFWQGKSGPLEIRKRRVEKLAEIERGKKENKAKKEKTAKDKELKAAEKEKETAIKDTKRKQISELGVIKPLEGMPENNDNKSCLNPVCTSNNRNYNTWSGCSACNRYVCSALPNNKCYKMLIKHIDICRKNQIEIDVRQNYDDSKSRSNQSNKVQRVKSKGVKTSQLILPEVL